MAVSPGSTLGKFLYAILFVALLPVALVAWEYGARSNVSLPAIQSTFWGSGLSGVGLLLWAAGVLELAVSGGGLPMNAFPPPKLTSRRVYALTAHPIYAGFTMLVVGLSLRRGSAAGLWLVSPVLALSAAALWWGYERPDLHRRLGRPRRAAWLGIPFADAGPARVPERVGALALALAVPALTALMLRGAGLAPHTDYWRGEPVVRAWTALGLFCVAALAPRSCRSLRNLVLTSWVGSLIFGLSVLALPGGPFGGSPTVSPDAVLVALLGIAGLAALLEAVRFITALQRWALAMAVGTFLAGRGSLPSLESLSGALAYTIAASRWRCWQLVLRLCEFVANCWRETALGAVRIIHIGWLAALPAAAAAAGAVVLGGRGTAAMTVWVIGSVIVGSALWAQLIEGSPALSRPYGFFGGVLAVVAFALLVAPPAFGASPWLVLGVFAVVAPWAQGIARLRCLANGCCHGAPCDASHGVVYRNPRTRVVRLAGLGGVPVHPTQLYSLTGNAVIAALLCRMWAEGARLALITGVYFVLMGLERFVEEAWRGEPQTPVYAGLRLYQWVSIASVAAGAALTAVPGSPQAPPPTPSLEALWAGLGSGAITWVVVSVDFPHSRRRFARLA